MGVLLLRAGTMGVIVWSHLGFFLGGGRVRRLVLCLHITTRAYGFWEIMGSWSNFWMIPAWLQMNGDRLLALLLLLCIIPGQPIYLS